MNSSAHAKTAKAATARRLGVAGMFLILLAIEWLPTTPLYLLGASSMAAGALVTCLIALICATRLYGSLQFRLGKLAWWLFVAWLTVGIHFAVAMQFQRVDHYRFFASWIFLAVYLAGARALASEVFMTKPEKLDVALKWVMAALLLCAVAGIFGLTPPGTAHFEKPVFPYTEPSHFALSFTPILLYFAVSSGGWRRWAWIITGFAVGLFMENLTTMSGAVLVAVVCALRAAVTLLPIAAMALASIVDFGYYLGRLNFADVTDNLSTAAYLQGWQLIDESLTRSSFWGIGFQQLGVNGTDVSMADLIITLIGINPNLNDGSFALSKLVSEFGVFGIALAIVHLALAWQAAHRLRQHAIGQQALSVPVRLAYAVALGFTIDIFVRGAGYFATSTLFYLASIIYLARTSADRQKSARRLKPLRARARSRRRPATAIPNPAA